MIHLPQLWREIFFHNWPRYSYAKNNIFISFLIAPNNKVSSIIGPPTLISFVEKCITFLLYWALKVLPYIDIFNKFLNHLVCFGLHNTPVGGIGSFFSFLLIYNFYFSTKKYEFDVTLSRVWILRSSRSIFTHRFLDRTKEITQEMGELLFF